MNLSRAEVHGVVTFYHDFRHAPPGRHVLKLCRAEACQSTGGDALAARAEAPLGVARRDHGGRPRHARAGLLPRPLRHGAVGDARRRVVGRLDDAKLDALIAECDAMTLRLFIPRDAGARRASAPMRSLPALAGRRRPRGVAVEIVRNGSRGLYWLEPMVEVETPTGRVAYGPVDAGGCRTLFDAGSSTARPHIRCASADPRRSPSSSARRG